MTLEKFSINPFTNTITNTLGMFWDTAKSYLTVESAHDDEGKITEIHQQIESGSSFISTLQQSASWFRYQPKKLLMLTGLALAYYANQTGYGNNNNKELTISYTINGMNFTSYVPFQAVTDWDYLVPSSTGTLAQFAMLYGASNLLSQSYQYNAANLLIAPLSLMALSSFLPILPAQNIETEFFKVFGANISDSGNAVKTTSTGEIVVAGSTSSFGAGGNADAFVAKFYANGSLAWARTLGGNRTDGAQAIALTPNDDIVVAGATSSFGVGFNDMLVAKLNANGSLAWVRTLGGGNNDIANALAITPNDDIVVAGYTDSFGAGSYDALVTKLYANGSLAWAHALGGSSPDYANALALTPFEDIVVAGQTTSFGAGDSDALIAKLYANGSLAWARTLGDSGLDYGYALALTPTNDIVLTGYTTSFGAGGYNALVAKLHANGGLFWARTLGRNNGDYGSALALTPTDDIVVAGATSSFGVGFNDMLVAKLNANGSLAWARTLGGSGDDYGQALALTPSDDIVLTGQTNSFGAGSYDVFVAKLDANGTIPGCNLTSTIQPTLLNWTNITNKIINLTVTSLNITEIIQDWTNINVQFIAPQSLNLCFAQRNGSINTLSSSAISTSASNSLTSNISPSSSQGSANSLTGTSSSIFSASTLPTSSTLTSTLSASDISTSLSSTSVDVTTTNSPSGSSTSPSASQSSSAYSFRVYVSTTPITIEQGTSTTLTSSILSISGNVPPSQVIYTIIGNNPDIVITVNGLEVTQFTQEDVEGNFVAIAIPGVTCGDDYSTDLQLEANVAGSNAPAQQASVSLVLDITTCSYAGRLSAFSYRDTRIGFWANNNPKERAERKVKVIPSTKENTVNSINFGH